jgi:hypothetical protein
MLMLRLLLYLFCFLLIGCTPKEETLKPLLVDTAAWKIADVSNQAVVLWQRAEPRERLTYFTGAANGGLIATDQAVIFLSAEGSDQSHSWLLGLDLLSGHESWRFSGQVFEYPKNMLTGFGYIRGVGDGYVFTSFDVVTKIDNTGQFIWRQDAFPSHQISQLFYGGREVLYIPTNSTIYQLDTARGRIQEKMPTKNLLGFFGDRIAIIEQIAPEASILQSNAPVASLKILDRQTNQLLSTIPAEQLITDNLILSGLMNFPILELSQNVLIAYDSPIAVNSTSAYNIVSGRRLWTLDRQMDGLPIILNHRLVMFSNSALELYDLETGQLVRCIPMERYENGVLDTSPVLSVWLAGYKDMIVVNFRSTREIVAVKMKA